MDHTGGWQSWTTDTAPVTVSGVHDLYAVFEGDHGGIATVNWLEFR